MTMLGIVEVRATTALRQLADDTRSALDRVALEERLARAAWTTIAEPGDRMAGLLVRTLGAVDAATVVLDGHPAEAIADRLQAVGEDVPLRDLDEAGRRWRPRVDRDAVLAALQQGVRWGCRLLVPGDPGWPSGVDDLGDHAPIALWLRGDAGVLATHDRSVALVGARAATAYGEHIAMEASAGLVDRGYTITSGAAYGIDGMAHRAALASSGRTVAFLAGGVDRFYPSGHETLLTRIAETGAVVSELPCGASPTKWRFLQRNRLIAASSLATVVLEAGWRSGSLNTAGHAAALGRPLGAVPGPVTSAASAGCHRLIREFDAVCVTTPDEMAELAPLGGAPASLFAGPTTEASPDTTRVIDALSTRSPRSIDDVAARAGLSVDAVRSVLGVLELEGRAADRERGWVAVSG